MSDVVEGEAPDVVDVEARKDMRRRLLGRLVRCVTGASCPSKAAEYVINTLTIHDTALLAAAAVTFARGEVEALLAAPGPDTVTLSRPLVVDGALCLGESETRTGTFNTTGATA